MTSSVEEKGFTSINAFKFIDILKLDSLQILSFYFKKMYSDSCNFALNQIK